MEEDIKIPDAPVPSIKQHVMLNTKAAAAMMGVKPGTLEKARSTGLGDYPPYIRLGGRRIGYLLSDIVAWLRARKFNNDGSPAYPKAA